MKTSYAEPSEPERQWPFQESGEECLSCKPIWESQDPPRPPKHLVSVYHNDGTELSTEERGIPIVVCPWCDGDLILRLDKSL